MDALQCLTAREVKEVKFVSLRDTKNKPINENEIASYKVGLGKLSGMNLIESKHTDTYCLGEECNIDLGSRICPSRNTLF